MKLSPTWMRAAAVLIVPLLIWAMVPAPTSAFPAGWSSTAAVTPVFLQPAGSLSLAMLPPIAPAPIQGVGTSVMPPGPPPFGGCSTDTAGGTCSATAPGTRCSAFNSNDNRCSTVAGANTSCSTTAPGAACSVLPPSGSGGSSSCSVGNVDPNSRCSALTIISQQKCSTKSIGSSICSALSSEPSSACSVFNVGATTKSFCSTKLNTAALAKNCSAFLAGAPCSIMLGGNGICTSFGSALPASCSAFASGAFCSVIGGSAGNPCAQ